MIHTLGYDQHLAERIRNVLADRRDLEEKKMFGGIAFMLDGKLCCGISKNELILRIGRDEEVKALRLAHTKPFDITGRPSKGWIMVKPPGYKTDTALRK